MTYEEFYLNRIQNSNTITYLCHLEKKEKKSEEYIISLRGEIRE